MRDEQIQQLLCLSHELSAFEDALAAPAARPATAPSSLRPWMFAIASAAAACVVVVPRSSPAPRIAPRSAPVVVHASPVAVRGATHSTCFRPVAQQPLSMVAIFRAWSEECDCLDWSLHRFEGEAALAALDTGESVDIELSQVDAPPVEQALLLLVASHAEALPRDLESARSLIGCLSDNTPVDGRSGETFSYVSAASSCLPPEVTLVSHSFVMARR